MTLLEWIQSVQTLRRWNTCLRLRTVPMLVQASGPTRERLTVTTSQAPRQSLTSCADLRIDVIVASLLVWPFEPQSIRRRQKPAESFFRHNLDSSHLNHFYSSALPLQYYFIMGESTRGWRVWRRTARRRFATFLHPSSPRLFSCFCADIDKATSCLASRTRLTRYSKLS